MTPAEKTIYAAIRDAALTGSPCPKNTTLCGLANLGQENAVTTIINRLASQGKFSVVRYTCAREVTFPDGYKTFVADKDRNVHWRDRRG